MTTTFRVFGFAAALALGTAFAASAATTDGTTAAIGTGANGGMSQTVPGAGTTVNNGKYGVYGQRATNPGYQTSQASMPNSTSSPEGMARGASGGTATAGTGDSGGGSGGAGAGSGR